MCELWKVLALPVQFHLMINVFWIVSSRMEWRFVQDQAGLLIFFLINGKELQFIGKCQIDDSDTLGPRDNRLHIDLVI